MMWSRDKNRPATTPEGEGVAATTTLEPPAQGTDRPPVRPGDDTALAGSAASPAGPAYPDEPPAARAGEATGGGPTPGGATAEERGERTELRPEVGPDVAPAAFGPGTGVGETRVALFEPEEEQRLRARWTAIQGSFIDDPRDAVAHADALVQDTVRSLHEMFQRERRQFEALWTDGSQASTEDLRLAVQRYRSLFERLLEK